MAGLSNSSVFVIQALVDSNKAAVLLDWLNL